MLSTSRHVFDSRVLPLLGKFIQDLDEIILEYGNTPELRQEIMTNLKRRADEQWSKCELTF